ncbi:MAG: hypothetical protein PGN13_10295 [Patulibacter minatonensis]
MLKAARLPGVRPIIAVYAIDVTLELALAVVLMVLVWNGSGSAALVALMLACKQILPGLLVGASVLGLEQRSRREVLVAGGMLRLAGLLLIALAPLGPLTFVGATLAGLGASMARTMLRVLLTDRAGEHLRRASAAFNIVFSLACVYAPIVGALLVSVLAPGDAVLVIAPAALISVAGGLWLTRGASELAVAAADATPASAPEGNGEEADPSGVSRAEAARAWRLIAVAAVAVFAMSMDEPALLAFTERVLGGSVADYGWILAAWGGGMFLGGLLYTRLVTLSTALLFGISTTLVGVSYLGLAASSSVPVALAVAVGGGIANGMLLTALTVATLEASPLVGTLESAASLELVYSSAPAVGMVVGGLLAEVAPLRLTLAVPGTLTILVVIVWALAERRAARAAHSQSARRLPAAVAPEAARVAA